VILLVGRSPIMSRRLAPGERRPVVLLLVAAGVLEAIFAVGFYLVIDGIGAVLTTLIVASSPVFSLAGGALFLRERIGWKLGLSAAVTIAGVLLATLARLTG
jgi:drug/metabolite transporter (DMT)-like permease